LAGLLRELLAATLLSERSTLGNSLATSSLIGGILGKNTRPKGATVMLRPLIFLLVLSAVPLAQNVPKAEGDETKIIALENLWNQMQISHDADAMGKMLDSDFVLTDYDGTVMSKGQFLASVRDTSNQLTVEVSTDMKLHRHGDTVIVVGATREKGSDKGKPYAHQGRFTDTWIKKYGQWLCIASQLGLIGK
jgi:ketosteroid isomerase-like protein